MRGTLAHVVQWRAAACLERFGPLACRPMTSRYLLIIIAVLTTIALSELLIQFHDFNKEQDCLSAGGGRRCGPVIDLHR